MLVHGARERSLDVRFSGGFLEARSPNAVAVVKNGHSPLLLVLVPNLRK